MTTDPSIAATIDVIRERATPRQDRTGEVLAVLMPGPPPLASGSDYARLRLMMNLASAITAYADSFAAGGNPYALDDVAVYAAMLNSLDGVARAVRVDDPPHLEDMIADLEPTETPFMRAAEHPSWAEAEARAIYPGKPTEIVTWWGEDANGNVDAVEGEAVFPAPPLASIYSEVTGAYWGARAEAIAFFANRRAAKNGEAAAAEPSAKRRSGYTAAPE